MGSNLCRPTPRACIAERGQRAEEQLRTYCQGLHGTCLPPQMHGRAEMSCVIVAVAAPQEVSAPGRQTRTSCSWTLSTHIRPGA